MVNFAAKLQSNMVVDWSDFYVDYDGLKKLIKKIGKQRMVALGKNEYQRKTYNDLFGSHILEAEETPGVHEVVEQANEEAFFSKYEESSALIADDQKSTTSYGSQSIASLITSDEEFLARMDKEINKVEAFYLKKVHEMQLAETEITHSISKVEIDLDLDADLEEDHHPLSKVALSAESMKRACVTLYRKLSYLKNFAVLNYTACVKITKKHDKVTKLKSGKDVMRAVNKTKFREGSEVQRILDRLESNFADKFCSGDVTVARSEILMKHRPRSDWQMMHLGLRMGSVLVLLLWTVWDTTMSGSPLPVEVFVVYRGLSCVVLSFWMWTVAVYVWNSAHVNYIYLFEFDPRHTLHFVELTFKSSTTTMTYLLSLLLYVKVSRGEIYGLSKQVAMCFPLACFIYFIAITLFPWSRRRQMILGACNTFIAPFGQVTFYSAFVGDLMTSFVKPLVDLTLTCCFFFSGEWQQRRFYMDTKDLVGNQINPPTCQSNYAFQAFVVPVVTSLPLWFRFAQNLKRYYDTKKRLPYLLNAFKYAMAFSLVLFGMLHPDVDITKNVGSRKSGRLLEYKVFFAVALVLSTLFTFIWDVRMDWGLGHADQNFLRKQMMYPKRCMYYVAIVCDLFLRFIWCVTLIPGLHHYLGSNEVLITPILAWLEIGRRTMWSCLRVEYEHLYNTRGYRRVDVVPLHFESVIEDKPKDKLSNKRSIILETLACAALVVGLAVLSFLTRSFD